MTDIKPLSTWDTTAAVTEFVPYRTQIDDRYLAEIQYPEDGTYRGTLVVFDHTDGDRLVHSEGAAIPFGPYGALLSPHPSVIYGWHARIIEVVDALGVAK